MEKYINGTSVELIKNWILAIEKDIKDKKFYEKKNGRDDLYITHLNKARLTILLAIFSINQNDLGDWVMCYEDSMQKNQKKIMEYFKILKSLLEIK